MWPQDMLLRPAVLCTKAVRNFKMAEKIYNNVFEIIEEVTHENDEAEYNDLESEKDELEDIVQCKMTELSDAAVELEPGLQPNLEAFKEHALCLVLPCLQLCPYPGMRSVDVILRSTTDGVRITIALHHGPYSKIGSFASRRTRVNISG